MRLTPGFTQSCWPLLLWLAINTAFADPLSSLTEQLGDIDTYAADFSQQILDQDQALVQESRGKLYAARPGKLRWLSSEPFEQLIVVDGSNIWRYEEDLEQVIVSPYSDDLGSTPALLLSGDIESIGARYEVSLVDGQYQLLPKDEQSLFRAMLVSIDDGKLTALVLEDTLGQTTVLQLENIRRNPELEPSLFQFEPPEGVDVLRDE